MNGPAVRALARNIPALVAGVAALAGGMLTAAAGLLPADVADGVAETVAATVAAVAGGAAGKVAQRWTWADETHRYAIAGAVSLRLGRLLAGVDRDDDAVARDVLADLGVPGGPREVLERMGIDPDEWAVDLASYADDPPRDPETGQFISRGDVEGDG